jgi:LysR family glycine cleavage system transcriptional activator
VCSPRLITGRPPLRKPADLGQHTLLHSRGRNDWAAWLAAAGIEDIDVSRVVRARITST